MNDGGPGAGGGPPPLTFPEFRARGPWWGGDLQTLRNTLLRSLGVRLPGRADPGQRHEFAMTDGSGDRLVASFDQPPQFSPFRQRPLVVLIHGLTGCETSDYIRATALQLLRHGLPVLRLNLRGAGPSRRLCRQQYHAGRSEDLRAVLQQLRRQVDVAGLVLVGFSLGANMLLKYLAEDGVDRDIRAAVAISPPFDLAATQQRIAAPRNRPYHRWLLARMREEALAAPGPRSSALDRAIRRCRSIYAFDDTVVAPQNGFRGADDYYQRCSARHYVDAIRVPTLLIHAADDPWIPIEPFHDFDWRRAPAVVPLLPAAGGHVGFHGRGSRTPWHDRCLLRFLEVVLGAWTPVAA